MFCFFSFFTSFQAKSERRIGLGYNWQHRSVAVGQNFRIFDFASLFLDFVSKGREAFDAKSRIRRA
jgi:hypothetical protein